MSTLILHNYPMSPFSEKTRAMLGVADLSWRSAPTREMPPRPVLAALAGGYRKVPLAQIGADIFCDTRIIAAEIAALSGRPLLDLAQCPQAARDFVREVDLQVFLACLMSSGSLALARRFWSSMPVADMARFLADRVAVGRHARVRGVEPLAAKARVRAHLADLETRLTQHDWLFGDQPCHADFSAYHSLWFLRDLAESPLLRGHDRVNAWMDRILAAGHGRPEAITPAQALEVAREALPRAVPAGMQDDPLSGREVSVAPADYAREATTGRLVGASAQRLILAREDAALGLLHVHFPREGYVLRAL